MFQRCWDVHKIRLSRYEAHSLGCWGFGQAWHAIWSLHRRPESPNPQHPWFYGFPNMSNPCLQLPQYSLSKHLKEYCQFRRFPLQKYFIPRCVRRGTDLDLRVCPAAGGGAGGVWKCGILPLVVEVEKYGFRTAWLLTGQQFQGVGLKLTAFKITFRDPSSHLYQKP